ncbi:AraC family transcriptional regulator [Streptomyces cinnamoneus]|uniref:AraC family transcriptional regulator n=1 Tax=Streptomyces cinnamoneus TaxID=53446 RepID=A0A2G1XJG5_STRCJ|nr:AraC family transcriptional regulator [Streptomyces cinnamoneus]PHQ51363.1 AraC family transcriptional regulator [Streptomyces cinnamoneus]PPT13589.1 AraC family transcriptional regulator [Streptomyces cinnamoneus]
MDPFDDLLRGVRADGAVLRTSVLSPRRALRFADGAALTLCVPLRGEGWIVPEDDGPPHLVGEGVAAIVRGPRPFLFTDEPAGPGSGARDAPAGETVLLAGSYRVQGEVSRRLLRVLPPVAVVPDDHDCAPLRAYFEAQLGAGRPGRQMVLDRLLDWLLVCTLRDWFDRPEACPPSWYLALGDGVVGPVLRAMHASPARPWTLAALAAEAGVSRTTMAARFTELLGEPPLAYLTRWRMDVAADLLAESAETVGAVARKVGYADAFGFSNAFKRVRGVSPTEHRRVMAAAS